MKILAFLIGLVSCQVQPDYADPVGYPHFAIGPGWEEVVRPKVTVEEEVVLPAFLK